MFSSLTTRSALHFNYDQKTNSRCFKSCMKWNVFITFSYPLIDQICLSVSSLRLKMFPICFQQNIPGHFYFFGPSNMLYVFNKIFLAISLPIRYALCLQQNIPSHFFWPLKYAICFQQNIPGHFLAHQICSMFSTKNHWPCSMPIRHALCFQQNIPGNIQRPLNILYTSNRISWAMFFQIYWIFVFFDI